MRELSHTQAQRQFAAESLPPSLETHLVEILGLGCDFLVLGVDLFAQRVGLCSNLLVKLLALLQALRLP